MRIPTYRARMAPTSEAPGRSINARMSPQAMAQAELAKAAPAQALTEAIGSYTKIRYDAEQELALNEGLLEAEELIRQLTDNLSKTKRLGDVFGGANLWKTQISEARSKILDQIGTNRFTRAKFTSRFDQMELSTRFQLKGVIDRKIEAAAQAAAAQRDAGIVRELSDPAKVNDDDQIRIYNQRLTGTVVDKAGAVSKGRYSGAAVSKSVGKMQIDIAKNVVGAKVAASPLMATDLLHAMQLQDKLNAGETLTEMDKVRIEDGGYTLHTLMNIPREDAINILKDALTDATAFQNAELDAIKRQEAESDKLIKSQIQTINEQFLRADPDKRLTLEEAQQAVDFLGINITDWLSEGKVASGEVSGADVLGVMRDYAYDYGDVDKEFEQAYKDSINRFINRPSTSNSVVVSGLLSRAAKGSLSMDDVEGNSSLLTVSDQTMFMNMVTTQTDRATNEAESAIRNALNYDANTIRNMDPDAAAKLSNETMRLIGMLNEEIETRRLAGDPMSQNEISVFSRKLITENPGLEGLYDQQYDKITSDATYRNFLGSIIDSAAGLPYRERPAQLMQALDDFLRRDDLTAAQKGAASDLKSQIMALKRRYEGLK